VGNEEFLIELNSTDEVQLTVKGRRSGRSITTPVWFVLEDEMMFLLPMYGFKTQWYRNLQADPEISIAAKKRKLSAIAKPILDKAKIADVVNRFRSKHGEDEVKKYYVKFDVVVAVPV
jgi:deazaflavin-dependent oxidoreductase (nitroreductase family)